VIKKGKTLDMMEPVSGWISVLDSDWVFATQEKSKKVSGKMVTVVERQCPGNGANEN